MFSSIHRHTQGRTMFSDTSKATSTHLVDPDKFPIWDLKEKTPVFTSNWSEVMGRIRYDVGWQIIVRDSTVEHPAGGRGVFLITKEGKKNVQVGDLLGLIPGRIYNSYNDYRTVELKDAKSYHRLPQHLHLPTGKILVFSPLSTNSCAPFGVTPF